MACIPVCDYIVANDEDSLDDRVHQRELFLQQEPVNGPDSRGL
jgi:hypothetical protein